MSPPSARSVTRQSSSRLEFYELLGVAKDVSEQDLKRAYRRKALRLHPDRGGDTEEFTRMKYAYDVLLDPKKRKAYNQYGEAGVKAMEGNMTPEVAMQLFLGISLRERSLLCAVIIVITGYFLLFPVLLCVRWDYSSSLSFAEVFIPIWGALVVVLGCCLCVIRAPTFDAEEDDEEMRDEIQAMQRQSCRLRVGGCVFALALSFLLALLVLRLDGEVSWSYFFVIWPWTAMEVVFIVYRIYTAGSCFEMSGGDPRDLHERKWRRKDWYVFLLGRLRVPVLRIIFTCLVAIRLDEYAMSWWIVFSPIWLHAALGVLQTLCKCAKVKPAADLEAMTEEARYREETTRSIVGTCCCQMIAVGFISLFCLKLASPSALSAYLVFLPVFVAGGCFCCCLTCVVCSMSPELLAEEEADPEAGTPSPVAAPSSDSEQRPAASQLIVAMPSS